MDSDERRQYCVKWMATTGKEWLQAGNFSPNDGSDLAGDDMIEPKVSAQALFAIVVGLDHFESVTTALASPQGLNQQFAPYSALRAALLAASQAVWMLGPDDRKDRQRRSLILARESAIEHRKAINGFALKEPTKKQSDGKQATLDELDKQVERVEKAAVSAKLDSLHKFEATAVIRTAAQIVAPDDEILKLAYGYLWRSGSAAAHGYPWRLSHSKDPMSFDVGQFDTSLHGSWLMLTSAIDLYDKRKG